MSTSIFHVRPLDSGKGWAIDEYDGRGAWQHSVPIGPDGAPMDKIQAQRAVFQLRRKAVNSAKSTPPVNRADADREAAIVAARHQLVGAFGIIRSHASDEHVQNYQRAIMLCDAALGEERSDR